MKRKLFLFLLALGIKAMGLPGQSTAGDTVSIEKIEPMDMSHYFFPLTKDTFNIFPENVLVNGVVEAVSTGTSCGVVCGCGTIKVRLQDSIPGYHYPVVFIAIRCFTGSEKEIVGKKVKAGFTKLPITNKECYYRELVVNTLDSGKIPFYIPADYNKSIFPD